MKETIASGIDDILIIIGRNKSSFEVLLSHTITKGTTHCMKQLIDIYEKYQKSTVALAEVPRKSPIQNHQRG